MIKSLRSRPIHALLLALVISSLGLQCPAASELKETDVAYNGFRDLLNFQAIYNARYKIDGPQHNNPDVNRAFWGDVENPVYFGRGKGTAADYFLKQPNPKFYFDDFVEKDSLIIVHAEKQFDERAVSKAKIEQLQRQFTYKQLPIINLYNVFPADDWFAIAEQPTVSQLSWSGENSIRVRSGRVTLVGGFWGKCHNIAMLDIIRQHFWVSSSELTIELPPDAIYANDENDKTMKLSELVGSKRLEKIQSDLIEFLQIDYSSRPGKEFPYNIPQGPDLKLIDYTLQFRDAISGERRVYGRGAKVINFVVE